MSSNIPDALDPRGVFAPDNLDRLSVGHTLSACYPIESGTGRDFVASALIAPLSAAMPYLEVRADIALKGAFNGSDWTAASGNLIGRFTAPLFGIPPTDRVVWLRFGCFQRWESGLVAETLLILDLPSLMIQAGVWPLAKPLGPDVMAPGPLARDGIWPTGDGAASLAIVEGMIGGLMKFDGSLRTMNMRDYFAENFWWFGPAPIGTFCGFADYERGHAGPFLSAFPDRVGGNHRARFGNGSFVASTGWPSINATHKGSGFLGVPASDRPVTMRVMDVWRAENAFLTENWVMIDLPDLLNQLGVDVFAALNDRI